MSKHRPPGPDQPHIAKLHGAWLLFCTLAAIAMLLLAGEHLYSRAVNPSHDLCAIAKGWGCRETLQHPWAIFLKLPTALWAVALYSLLFQLGPATWSIKLDRKWFALLLTGLLGAASIAFVITMERDFVVPCPLCLLAHLCHLLLLGIALVASRSTSRELRTPDKAFPRTVALLPAAAVLLIGAMLTIWGNSRQEERSRLRALADPALRGTVLAQNHDRFFPASPEQIIAGPSDSGNRLTIIGSLACRHCRALLSAIETIPREMLTATSICFVPYPLAGACNPAAKKAGLPEYIERCRLAERTLQAQADNTFTTWLATVNHAPGRILRRMQTETPASQHARSEQLAGQIAIANTIPVRRIPLLLWNGRPLPSFLNSIPLAILLRHLTAGTEPTSADTDPEDCDC